MDLKIDLNFIPKNLDNAPLLGTTLAVEIGRLLCEGNGTDYALEKYTIGKELFTTGFGTFKNSDTPEGKAFIEVFKQFCEQHPNFQNEVKGQILLKFI